MIFNSYYLVCFEDGSSIASIFTSGRPIGDIPGPKYQFYDLFQ